VKVLFFVQGENVPSSRFRAFQLLPALREAGVQCEALATNPSLHGDWKNKKIPQPFKEIFRPWSVVERLRQLPSAKDYDLVVIQKPLIRYGSIYLEKKLSQEIPCIYDLDDALFHNLGGLCGFQLKRIMPWMSHLVAGNQYIADYFQAPHKTSIIPTVVDTDRYALRPYPTGEFRLCWTGLASNIPELQIILPALKNVLKNTNGKLILVSNATKPVRWLSDLPVEYVRWSPETEVKALESAHVGLMPLRDTPYNRGKCGFKLIQYMARGIPVVTHPVGANKSIVRHGVDGYWANTLQEWEKHLLSFYEEPQTAKEMGQNAREQILQHFSLKSVVPKWLQVFQNQISSKTSSSLLQR
jgi:glycosyltransferase involved in cell wall biosynthesis